MKKFIKNINGEDIIKYRNQIIVYHDDLQTINPSDELLLNDGWKEYIPEIKELTSEEILNNAKILKQIEIEQYDNSSEINECYIEYNGNKLSYWANKNERSILKTAIQDCILMNRETYRLDLRDLNISITIPCTIILQMLAALEIYAIDCYNTTTDHIYAINAINNIDDLNTYNYKLNYPDKLIFTI